MKDSFEVIVSIVVLIAVMVAWGFMGYWQGKRFGQKVGQIDCINGNVYYELVLQDDNTTEWRKK